MFNFCHPAIEAENLFLSGLAWLHFVLKLHASCR